ncbi:hypothetical protein WJX81_004951 [Elliptochloris bilobata]|uniref:Serine aminopeptidase S33 domain-containing protein n=1 Tax=Elliptochloris bilobata TaxID=381761 RepID=A0AAW1SKS4_9CHLO
MGSSVNARGLRLACYYWPASKPQGVVLFVHGHGAYLLHELLRVDNPGQAPQYKGSWVDELNARGFSVCGLDQQGLGFSEGLRGYVERFDDYVADVLQLAKSLATCEVAGFAGKPLFIAGCSLGGCIAVNAIHQRPELFTGAALLAPMLSLEKASRHGLNPYLRPLAGLISWLAPTLMVVATTRNTLYPHLQAIWDEDPLCWHGATRARNATEYLIATSACLAMMPQYSFPFVVFHGEDDTLCDVDGSRQLFERAKSTDKELHIIPMRWHVIIKEPGNEEILRDMIAWMEKRLHGRDSQHKAPA